MRKCSVPWCDRNHYARGFCEKHYRRWMRGPGHWKSYLDLEHCLFCRDRLYAKGMCRNHYEQWKRGIAGRKLRENPDIVYYGPDKDEYPDKAG